MHQRERGKHQGERGMRLRAGALQPLVRPDRVGRDRDAPLDDLPKPKPSIPRQSALDSHRDAAREEGDSQRREGRGEEVMVGKRGRQKQGEEEAQSEKAEHERMETRLLAGGASFVEVGEKSLAERLHRTLRYFTSEKPEMRI